MNYEKAYKEALNKAQKELQCCGDLDCDAAKQIFRIFPELQKSEDELIREELIKFLERQNFIAYESDHDYRKWLSWLEKQKTTEEALQYLKENHSPSEVSDFQAAMNIAVAKAYNKGYADGLEKQGEQKPSWSENDEYQFNTILHGLYLKREIYKKEGNKAEEERYNTQYNWLKSLKNRIKKRNN